MSQGARDWVWSAGIGCALTVISTLALAVPPTNDMIRVISYVGAPGALTGITLAVLTTGSYGGSGSFILTIAAMVNLIVYTLVVVSVIRAFRRSEESQLKGQANRSGAMCGKERTTSVTQIQRGEAIMTDEIVFHHGTTTVRRLRLAPGEAMPWHRDPFNRVAVVLCGDALSIEYRDGGESQRVEVTPGQVEWEEPSARVHRAVNVGKRPYEQVTVFLLDRPDAEAQPTEE